MTLDRDRKLDDEDLDSGDDEGRADRTKAPEAVDEEHEQHTFAVMDADIARHAIPEPSDGELYLLKVPRFLSFDPTAFSHKTFQPPTTDHHSKLAASEQFSAYNTAMSTIRWRRSPSNNAELQSSARILRWSDGSLTLQLANDPTTQFDIDANTLAPPQVNPKIPTPTSLRAGAKPSHKLEGYTFLVAPYEEANVMRVTNKFTTSLNIVPAANLKDTALEKLQNDLAQIASRGRDEADQAISFVDVSEDPELRRQREEATFKEKQRQARAREKHEARQAERAVRTVGRSGGRAAAGLSLDDLEDNAARPRKPRQKGGLRRDWSDDEDYGGRGAGRSREDDYDEEDDFIAASDEEPEIVDDDDDLDDGIAPSPKRRAGGDDDDDTEVVVNRTKRRRVVADDEDEE